MERNAIFVDGRIIPTILIARLIDCRRGLAVYRSTDRGVQLSRILRLRWRGSHRVLRGRILQLVESSNCGVLSTLRTLIAFPTGWNLRRFFPLRSPKHRVSLSSNFSKVLLLIICIIVEELRLPDTPLFRSNFKLNSAKSYHDIRSASTPNRYPIILSLSWYSGSDRYIKILGESFELLRARIKLLKELWRRCANRKFWWNASLPSNDDSTT